MSLVADEGFGGMTWHKQVSQVYPIQSSTNQTESVSENKKQKIEYTVLWRDVTSTSIRLHKTRTQKYGIFLHTFPLSKK